MIRVLPPEVANRIAAGEVVERPASIVKELLENALDAGASSIEIEVREGGIELVRVRDDGRGMSAEELALCVLPHATSKIADVDDLFRVASYGFRGEALPSIGAVATLTITTRRADAEGGHTLTVSGGTIGEVRPAAAPVGTTVEVRDLFANVPARRHFLRQPRTEVAQVLEVASRLALPEPGVALTVRHGDRLSLDLPADTEIRSRLRRLHGGDLVDRLLAIEATGAASEGHAPPRLEAWVGPPDLVRASARLQALFLNGRFVRDRGLLHALRDAYRGWMMPKEHPVGFLFLSVDPALVDVNVHPQKTEVRFRDRDALFSLVRRSIRTRLTELEEDRPLKMGRSVREGAPTAAESEAKRGPQEVEGQLFARSGAGAPAASGSIAPAPVSGAQAPAAKSDEGGAAGPSEADRAGSCAHSAASAAEDLEAGFEERFGGARPPAVLADGPVRGRGCAGRSRETDAAQIEVQASNGEAGAWLQMARSWLVVEMPDGIRIVDQHALHERKLYDEILARFAASAGEEQVRLVPEVVELGITDAQRLLDRAEDLARIGVGIEAFGPGSVALRSLPSVLDRLSGREAIEEVLTILRDGGRGLNLMELVRETAASLACRAAIKFDQSLPADEIAALLAWWREHPEARNCPHGRPVAVAIGWSDLENQFLRKK